MTTFESASRTTVADAVSDSAWSVASDSAWSVASDSEWNLTCEVGKGYRFVSAALPLLTDVVSHEKS